MKIEEKTLWKPWPIILYLIFGKYGGLSLYDIYIENIYTIDYDDINFVKKYGHAWIGNRENPDRNSTDHEYFLGHDDLFDRILKLTRNKILNQSSSPKMCHFHKSMKLVHIQGPSWGRVWNVSTVSSTP